MVLPTGKNIHALDPQSIPTQAALKSARIVVERCVSCPGQKACCTHDVLSRPPWAHAACGLASPLAIPCTPCKHPSTWAPPCNAGCRAACQGPSLPTMLGSERTLKPGASSAKPTHACICAGCWRRRGPRTGAPGRRPWQSFSGAQTTSRPTASRWPRCAAPCRCTRCACCALRMLNLGRSGGTRLRAWAAPSHCYAQCEVYLTSCLPATCPAAASDQSHGLFAF